MVLAFDKSSVVKEYKEEIEKLQKEKDKLAKKLGETIVEKEWLEGKLRSLDLSKRIEFIKDDSPHVQAESGLSLNKKLERLCVFIGNYRLAYKENIILETFKHNGCEINNGCFKRCIKQIPET